jgi:predicted nucleic acid-binding protein
VKKYYFDTNPLMKCYRENEKGHENVLFLVKTANPIFLSPLTCVEVIGVFAKYMRKTTDNQSYKSKNLKKLVRLLKRSIGYNENSIRPFRIISTPTDVFKQAESILLNNVDCNIQTNDALHLAIVKKQEFPTVMVTSDRALKNVCRRMNVEFYDPESGVLS